MVNRHLRLPAVLATSALAISLTAVGTSSVAAAATARPDHSGLRAAKASPEAVRRAPSARAAASSSGYPVGSRTGSFGAQNHTVTPSGTPAQRLVKASVTQDRAPGSIAFSVQLGAVPTAASDATIVVAFGTLTSDRTMCANATGISFDSLKASGGTKSLIKGALASKAARTASWNCAFVQSFSTDGTTKYDALSGPLTDHVQKPKLGFKVKGARIDNRHFTKVHVTIFNSDTTVAKAKHVKLSWTTRKVLIHADRNVGTIKPGAKTRGVIFVKSTARGLGRIKLTASCQGYHHSITLKVHPVRAHQGHHKR